MVVVFAVKTWKTHPTLHFDSTNAQSVFYYASNKHPQTPRYHYYCMCCGRVYHIDFSVQSLIIIGVCVCVCVCAVIIYLPGLLYHT